MTWQFNIYALPLLAITLPLAFFAALVYQRRRGRLVNLFLTFCLATTLMAITGSLRQMAGDPHTSVVMSHLNVFSVNLIPVVVLFLFVDLMGLNHWVKGWRGWLVISPVILANLAILTNSYHHLYWKRIIIDEHNGIFVSKVVPGTLEIWTTYYIYAMMLATIAMMVYAFGGQKPLQRRQYLFLVPAIAIPVLVDALQLLGLIKWEYIYPTPYAIFISVTLLGFALLRYRFMDLLPFAQDQIFTLLSDPLIVIDENQRVLGANNAAKRTFTALGDETLEPLLSDVVDPDFVRAVMENGPAGFEWTRETAKERETWNVKATILEQRDGLVSGQVITMRDITSIQETADYLSQTLKEKDLLFRELHHRVKNNFTLVSSMLGLEAARASEESLKSVLRNSQNRIHSMARVHELLYQKDEFHTIRLDEYLIQLVEGLIRFNTQAVSMIRLNTDVEPVDVSIEQAIPCGLIVNELVTNSLKYAFRKETVNPTVWLYLKMLDDLTLELGVADNGLGFPTEEQSGSALGLQLVKMLTVDQLGGSLNQSNENGSRFTCTFQLASPLS